MSTISCRQCRMPVDAAAVSCPHCGAPDPSGSAATSGRALRRRRGVYIALAIAAALFVAFCFTSDDAEGLTRALGPEAAVATAPHARVELIVGHYAAAGVVAVHRANEAVPMPTQHTPPDQRP